MNKKVIVSTSGKNKNKLILKIYDIGISINNINYTGNNIEFETTYDNYKLLRKYLKSYNFKIKKYAGSFFIISMLKKYKVFLINIILSLIILFILSNTIVSVKVYHSNKYIRNIIYSSLEESGVKKLSWKKSYKELTKIKEKILNKYKDDIEWLEIEKKGMNYIVRVEQRIIPKKEESNEYCNIIAKKDAVIKSINYSKGQTLVDVRDYVKEGSVLISGKIMFNEETKSYTCASGEVIGEVWYETSISLPLEKRNLKKTGKKRYNFMINRTKIFKSRLKKYQTKKKKVLNIFGIDFYLLKEYEVKERKYKLSEKEALEEALKLSNDKIKLKLNEKESIITQKVLKKSINNSTMYVEIFTTTNEVISKIEKSEIEEEKEVE